MKVAIDFKKYIIENNEKEIETEFKTNGIYFDNQLKFIDESQGVNQIFLNLFEVSVARKSEVQTYMSFKKGQKTKFKMEAPFGELEIEIYTNELVVNKNSLFIVYSVLEDFNSYKIYELHITFTPLK